MCSIPTRASIMGVVVVAFVLLHRFTGVGFIDYWVFREKQLQEQLQDYIYCDRFSVTVSP